MSENDQREVRYGRRSTDNPGGSDDPYVRRSELEEIIQITVQRVLDEYEHVCLMNLKEGDTEHVRDLVGAVREIGDGNLPKGIVIIRENHKFVAACHRAAAKIGWGVIIATATVIGAMGILVVSMWRANGGPSS